MLGHIPFKGAVLNLLAAWWFEKTKHLVPNHLISVPHPNVTIAKNCTSIPVEMVVRGYISGVTKTSIWYSYNQGERVIYGIKFPDGLKKNQKLPTPVITPTTHGGGKGGHDERLTKEEIIKRKLVSPKMYAEMERTCLELFKFGSNVCKKQGLILVDTKYEFGLYDGTFMLMDEIHTPDSSRFWKAATYEARFKKGLEPENFDKEFLRLWYVAKGYQGDGPPPPMSEQLVVDLAQRYIDVYETITSQKFYEYSYPIENEIQQAVSRALNPSNKNGNGITYESAGVNYAALDQVKRLAQQTAKRTSFHLKAFGMSEVSASRGESAYVWEETDSFRALVIEGLGTKNLVADAMRKITGKTYYDTIAQDAVAMIVNDLITVGAAPQVINAYFAVGSSDWFNDEKRAKDLVAGWTEACELAGVVWGGGETPTLKKVIEPDAIDLAGAAVGIVTPKTRLLLGDKITSGDRILLVESNGIHANGLTLARAVADALPQGYESKLTDGTLFGEVLLKPTHIYVKLVAALFAADIDIHYMVNITGHGWRKLMRAARDFVYQIETVPEPQAVFTFIQEHSKSTEAEMYGTFNMGAGFAFFIPESECAKAQSICTQHGFKSWNSGYVKRIPKRVEIKPKRIIFSEGELAIR
ncbi:MAG: Phosphoribosylformylglycinamidine cyclo-ligase [Candidatus Gottesmanbacteria bacterium GW2011_GWA1_43_11]|uniref:phosphoribosylaminoimidazolesuccinocarboxamide synthase n=1 Tax=Candidatus Gottesmanbacteria bacterium GW2011_GWA1_43_11 TaxID=1618436 RepID=A0A0G1F997_9BACT|nr:MAG: Phosphoribosylformylglycinamidine cyclo-ligase [Candidatus Gottesmanbacteria bacterium GW2011_GWA1_43_11]